jgi:hypothetical protein
MLFVSLPAIFGLSLSYFSDVVATGGAAEIGTLLHTCIPTPNTPLSFTLTNTGNNAAKITSLAPTLTWDSQTAADIDPNTIFDITPETSYDALSIDAATSNARGNLSLTPTNLATLSYSISLKSGLSLDPLLYPLGLSPYMDTPLVLSLSSTASLRALPSAAWNSVIDSSSCFSSTDTPPIPTYAITWRDDDNTILETDTNVPYGALPSYDGSTPTKPSTVGDPVITKDEDDEICTAITTTAYAFAGWTPAVVPATGNATYTATYTPTISTSEPDCTPKSYTVEWQNHDGTEIETTTHDYGATPTHAYPTLPLDTAQYSYTNPRWDCTPLFPLITNTICTFGYTETLNTYAITWLDADGALIDTTNVPYGELPTHSLPADTTQWHYTGWTPTISIVSGAATYAATRVSNLPWPCVSGSNPALCASNVAINNGSISISVKLTTTGNNGSGKSVAYCIRAVADTTAPCLISATTSIDNKVEHNPYTQTINTGALPAGTYYLFITYTTNAGIYGPIMTPIAIP